MPNPYDKTTHDGKVVDWLTHAALLEAELKLGYRLTIVQGSYHKGVGASAGTHDGGGVVDLAPWDWQGKVKALRSVGFAIWHRTKIPGVWNEHVHGVLIGNTRLAPAAAAQITDYRNRRDGLARHGADNTWHPSPIPAYQWPGSAAALALEKKAAAKLDPPPKPVVTALRVDGIDLSHHNTVTQPGLNAAAALGAKYAYLKTSEGATVLDATYLDRRTMVRRSGMQIGAYHFARPDADGKDGAAEARFFLDHARLRAGDMRPALDLEDAGGLSRKALTAWVGDFVRTVKAEVGCLPVIYTPFPLDDNFGCMLWVARYSDANAEPVVPAPWQRWRMRQFSDGKFGKPNSIAGMKIDLNTLHDGEDLDWLRIPVKPVVEPPPPVVVPPVVPPVVAPPVVVPDPPPVVAPPAAPVTFVDAHFNSQRTDSGKVGTPQLRAVIKAADLIGLNEIESLWQRLVLKSSPKFGMFPTLGVAAYDPILWRKDRFDVVRTLSTKAYSGESGVTPTAYVNEVELLDKVTGKTVTRICAHPPAHIESGGKARVYTKAELPKYAHQLERARAIFTLLRDRAVAAQAKGAVIVSMDANVSYGDEAKLPKAKRVPWFPLTTLGSILKPVLPAGGSLGSRAVDWVLLSGGVSRRSWHGARAASDHLPAFNEVELSS